MAANMAPPVVRICLFLGEPPKNVLVVASFGTGLGIHFSSSVGIDMKLTVS